ncbi:MAG: hypothetical protein WCX22_13235 [Methanoregula sp.]|jgi:hypothetical protein
MTETEIKEFENDMLITYGVNLSATLPGEQGKVTVFANRVEMIVHEEIKNRCPSIRFSELETSQTAIIYKAILEQAYYMVNNYDMTVVSGFDPVNNSVVPIQEIQKRTFSPLARQILKNGGLLYSGMGKMGQDTAAYERSFWR